MDAQLPLKLADVLRTLGHSVIHTVDLPNGNMTTDASIIATADLQERIIISKDSDFLISYRLSGKPKKLLLISTGNISNHDLNSLFITNMQKITDAFIENNLVELTSKMLIIHE